MSQHTFPAFTVCHDCTQESSQASLQPKPKSCMLSQWTGAACPDCEHKVDAAGSGSPQQLKMSRFSCCSQGTAYRSEVSSVYHTSLRCILITFTTSAQVARGRLKGLPDKGFRRGPKQKPTGKQRHSKPNATTTHDARLLQPPQQPAYRHVQ